MTEPHTDPNLFFSEEMIKGILDFNDANRAFGEGFDLEEIEDEAKRERCTRVYEIAQSVVYREDLHNLPGNCYMVCPYFVELLGKKGEGSHHLEKKAVAKIHYFQGEERRSCMIDAPRFTDSHIRVKALKPLADQLARIPGLELGMVCAFDFSKLRRPLGPIDSLRRRLGLSKLAQGNGPLANLLERYCGPIHRPLEKPEVSIYFTVKDVEVLNILAYLTSRRYYNAQLQIEICDLSDTTAEATFWIYPKIRFADPAFAASISENARHLGKIIDNGIFNGKLQAEAA